MIVNAQNLKALQTRGGIKSAPGCPCFKCGKPVALPFVVWSGETEVALHPECASKLATHLFFDGLLARL